MRLAVATLLLIAWAAPALARPAPLPPPRPADLTPADETSAEETPAAEAPAKSTAPQPPPRPPDLMTYAPEPGLKESTPSPSPLSEGERTCEALLASSAVVAERMAPISGPGACGIAAPVSIKAVVTADKREIELVPRPVLRCEIAAELADWLLSDVVPRAQKSGGAVVRIRNAAAYDCRGRNRQRSAKLSEHAHGNAIDMRSLEFADGRSVEFVGRSADRALIADLRTSACARFSTVLGPGSDGYHEDHVHVDLYARRPGVRICKWNVR